jgi:hypothetical protein
MYRITWLVGAMAAGSSACIEGRGCSTPSTGMLERRVGGISHNLLEGLVP